MHDLLDGLLLLHDPVLADVISACRCPFSRRAIRIQVVDVSNIESTHTYFTFKARRSEYRRVSGLLCQHVHLFLEETQLVSFWQSYPGRGEPVWACSPLQITRHMYGELKKSIGMNHCLALFVNTAHVIGHVLISTAPLSDLLDKHQEDMDIILLRISSFLLELWW